MNSIKFLFRKKFLVLFISFFVIAGITGFSLISSLSTPDAIAGTEIQGVPGSFSGLAKTASPSVVNITTVKTIKGGGISRAPIPFGPDDPFRDFFERFFRDQVPREYRQKSLGTGFIIDRDGYILTNNHVVEMADEIGVILEDKREFDAKIIGRDEKTDLALIKIDGAKDLVPLTLGDSEKLDVGEWVVAIGNPFGLGHTVTAGIVSAKFRQIGAEQYENFIQTDASINPGNSGGPLLNTSGEVIGINTAIFSQTGGSVGIGFAIPVNMAKDLLPQLKKGKVVRGWLGVIIQEITSDLKDKLGLKDKNGALVADVTADGPAEKAGIKRGDVIVAFNGKDIKDSKELPYIVSSTPVGETVTVDVVRNGRKLSFEVKLGELKDDAESQIFADTGPDLGLTVDALTPENARRYGLPAKGGVIVVQVDNNSPAEEAGLRQGDIILEIDRESIKDVAQFHRKIGDYKQGDIILLLVQRRGASIYLTLKVWEKK